MINNRKRAVLLFIVSFFFTFTLILFGPYEIFLLNNNDFSFGFIDIWQIIAIFAMAVFLIVFGIGVALRGKMGEYYCILVFAGTLCGYIQTMLMNGEMYSLIGNDVGWRKSTIVINLGVWLAVIAGCFALRFGVRKYWKKVIYFLSVAIVLMQGTALISLLFTRDLAAGNNGYLSEEGILEVSSEENVVFFIVDYFDGTYMKELLDEDEDYLEPLKGFTYFPNAASVHSRTFPSITYLLTGSRCYFDTTTKEYLNSAYEKSIFWNDLVEQRVNIGLYTYGEYLGDSAKDDISNYVMARLEPDRFEVLKSMMKMSFYRSAPYVLKNVFKYDADRINNLILGSDKEREGKFRNSNDKLFYDKLKQGIQVTGNDKMFRFYHLEGCHADLTNPVPYGKFSLQIIYEYIRQLQDLGIYDKTIIIIAADHGSSGGGETLDFPQKTAVPLIMVKPKSADEKEELKISDAPVSQEDLFGTILAGFDCEDDAFPNTVFDFRENQNRERYYYYSALYDDQKGEIELREYRISGDAREAESYHFTGNTWPIQYSLNRVSK